MIWWEWGFFLSFFFFLYQLFHISKTLHTHIFFRRSYNRNMKWLWLFLTTVILAYGQNISQYESLDSNSSFFNSTQAAIEQARETRIHLLWGISLIVLGTVACVAAMTILMTLLLCSSADESEEVIDTSTSECFPCYGICLLMMFFAHFMGGCWNVIPTCCAKCKKRRRRQRHRDKKDPIPLIPLGHNVASSLHLSESTFRGEETDTVDASDILDEMMY